MPDAKTMKLRAHYLSLLLVIALCACQNRMQEVQAPQTVSAISATRLPLPTAGIAITATPYAVISADQPDQDNPTAAPAREKDESDDLHKLYGGALREAFRGDLASAQDMTQYEVQLRLSDDLTAARGIQRVRYVNRGDAPMREMLLRLYPNTAYLGGHMAIQQLELEDGTAEPMIYTLPALIMSQSITLADTSLVSFTLRTPLEPGQAIVFTATYTISIPAQSSGGYLTYGWSNDILSLPNAYLLVPPRQRNEWRVSSAPTYGDIVFSEVGLYRVRMRVPINLVVVATGKCTEESAGSWQVTALQSSTAQWKEVICVAGPVRDFAVHASRYYQMSTVRLRSNLGDVTVSSYYLPTHEASGKRALDWAANAFMVYERRFGAYPFNELKVFASPVTAGGIEYPMLAGVLHTLYEQEGGHFEWIVAHEVAHQWWYSMVGSDPINEAWLDEALTQYSTSLYLEDRYGDLVASAERERYFMQRYQRELDIGRDASVTQPTGAFERTLYAPIVYGKGPLFFDAVRRAVGDRLFAAWLRVYYARFRYGIASGTDLLKIADEMGIGSPVRMAFDEWMRSTRLP